MTVVYLLDPQTSDSKPIKTRGDARRTRSRRSHLARGGGARQFEKKALGEGEGVVFSIFGGEEIV